MGPIDNKSAWAWCWTDAKPLAQPMMTEFIDERVPQYVIQPHEMRIFEAF